MIKPETLIVFKASKAPFPGIVVDLVEYSTHVAIRFYRDNFNDYPDAKQVLIAEWIMKLQQEMNESGTPTVIEMEDRP